MNFIQILALPIFCLTIFVTPWVIGGNYPYVRTAVIACGSLLCLLALVRQLMSTDRLRLSSLWYLLLIGAAYALFQVAPGSRSIVESVISLPDNFVMTESGDTISAYPAASRERIVELLGGIAIFFSATCLLYRRKSIYAVMVTAVLVGVLLGFLAIVQNLSWNGKILWFYEMAMGGSPFGPFVNKNNAGGFLLACFSAATFVVSYQIISWQPYGKSNTISEQQYFTKQKFSPIKSVAGVIAGLQTRHLYALTGMAFIAAAIVASLSRGATSALAVCAAASMILLSSINRWIVVLMLLVAASSFGLMVYSEQTESVITQAETMTDLSKAAAPRLLHWNDALPYVKENYVLGSGPGTYPYLYIATQERHFERWFRHAENVYLETLAEMGIIGLTLLLASIGLCLYSSWKLFVQPDKFDRALGVAGVCLITGQAVAWLFDFGIYHPPNMAIVAILAGTVVGRWCYLSAAPEIPYRYARVFRVVALGAMAVACCFGAFESRAIEALNESKLLMNLYDSSSGRADNLLDKVESRLQMAYATRPDDSEVLYQLGEYHVARYRQQAVQRVVNEAKESVRLIKESQPTPAEPEEGTEATNEPPSQSVPPTDTDAPLSETEIQLAQLAAVDSIEKAWPVTTLSTLHRLAHITNRFQPDELKELRESEEVKEHLHAAWDAYEQSENACNSLPKTRFRLAQLSMMIDEGESEWEHVESSLSRMPTDSQLLYDCGLLAIHAAKPDEATQMWGQCMTYTRRFEEPIVQFGKRELSYKHLFENVLPQDPFELLRIAKKYFKGTDQTLPQRLLLVHTRRLTEKVELPEEAKFYLRAESERLSGDLPSAANSYKLALDVDPDKTDWRFVYARTLHQLGKYDDAIKQLKICQLQSRRKNATYSRLIKRIQRDRKRNPQFITN